MAFSCYLSEVIESLDRTMNPSWSFFHDGMQTERPTNRPAIQYNISKCVSIQIQNLWFAVVVQKQQQQKSMGISPAAKLRQGVEWMNSFLCKEFGKHSARPGRWRQGQGMRTTELSDHRNLLIFLLCYRFSALKLHNKSLSKVPKESSKECTHMYERQQQQQQPQQLEQHTCVWMARKKGCPQMP